jgi:hypothetical protein
MNKAVQQLIDAVFEAINRVYEREQARIAEIRKWSPIHGGINDFLKITCSRGTLALDTYEPFGWDDHQWVIDTDNFANELSVDEIHSEFLPVFEERLQSIFISNRYGESFFRHKLDFYFDIHIEGKEHSFRLRFDDQARRERFKQTLDLFIERKVLSEGKAVPKEDDLFHLLRNVLDEDLFTLSIDELDDLLQKVSLKVGISRKLEEQWQGTLLLQLKSKAEQVLGRYFNRTGNFNLEYEQKQDLAPDSTLQQELDLLLYIALKLGPLEADIRKTYLELAVQLGSETARQYLQNGSGRISSVFDSPLVQIQANDVLQTVEVHMLAEQEAAYREALGFLYQILREGFPHAYHMKLKGTEKHFVPVKKLAKSKLHQFFGNALQYPALHPEIAEYAALVMEEFAWYSDVEPGEKSAMPGTYAVMGLGLANEQYFPLVLEYIGLVDEEHQSVQDHYPEPFIEAHGLSCASIPVLVSLLLAGSGNAKCLKSLEISTAEQAQALAEAILSKEDYQREIIMYRIWGGVPKFKKALQQADQEVKEALSVLL